MRYIGAGSVVLAVAGLGTFLLIISHASTPYSSTAADQGTLKGATTILPNSSASDGNYIQFGSNQGPRAANGPLYNPSSVWDTPIAPNSTLAPNNSSLIVAFSDTSVCGSKCLTPQYDFTPAIWVADNSTPTIPVVVDYPTCDAKTVQVPIPAGTVPDSSREGHMVILQSDSGVEYDFFGAQSPGQAPKSDNYGLTCPTIDGWTSREVKTTDWQTGNGFNPAFGGWGYAEAAGVVLPRDTQQPAGSTWDHALALTYANTCSDTMSWCPIVAPGTSEDGVCTVQSQCVPEGARFQLDPSIDCDTWPSLQYEWQRQMCRTFQVYGGIVVDSDGAGLGGATHFYDQWRGSLGSYTWPWLQPPTDNIGLPDDLLSHFRVLAW